MPNPSGPERRKNFLSDRVESADAESDHDLLIKVKTNFSNLVDLLEGQKEDTDTRYEDHEKRLRDLERDRWILIGAFVVIQLALKFIIK